MPFTSTPAFSKNPLDDDDRFKVRHWEKYGPRPQDVREIRDDTQENLEKELKKLRKEIDDLRSDIKEPEDEHDELDDLFAEIEDPNDTEDHEQLQPSDVSSELEVNFTLPRTLRIYIRDFNKLVRIMAQDFSNGSLKSQNQSALWLQYLRCKRSIPSFIDQVPEATWDILWESQYNLPVETEDRKKHLWMLVDDIAKASQELSPAQKLIKIERLFSEGDQKRAVELWRRERQELQEDENVSDAFIELGVRLMVASGRLEKAQELALETTKDTGKVRTENLAPLIAGWAGKDDEASVKVAWALYLYMREHKGSDITLEDFDQIIMCFLRCNRLNLALAAFKDMILAGKSSPFDSAELALKAPGLHGELRKKSNGLADLNEVSLTALAYRPGLFENRYFYGSWIKRLIGMDKTQAATQVLQLMFERGFRPDAKHINGIMGAWLRGNDNRLRDFAIQIGWTMVKERLKFVAQRRAADSGTPVDLDVPDPGLKVPPYISRNLPSATIETFSILLHHYERRDMQSTIQQLPAILERAEIMPNSYFMNHLIYARLRRGDTAGAWAIFRTKTTAVRPDLESFAALWDCQKARLGWHGIGTASDFPAPRAMFSHMLSWYAALSPSRVAVAREEFTQDLYNQILRCICLSRDVEGTLVALYALRDAFGFYPDASTVRLVTIQLARLSEPTATAKQRRARLAESRQSQKRLGDVMRLLESITKRRAEALAAVGKAPDALTPEEGNEEGLYRMNVLLRLILRTRDPELSSDEAIDKRVETVAFTMGAGSLDMSTPLHFCTKN